jgi:hypothetical protein
MYLECERINYPASGPSRKGNEPIQYGSGILYRVRSVAVLAVSLCRCVAVSPSVFGIYDSVFSVFMDKVNFGIKTNLCQEF